MVGSSLGVTHSDIASVLSAVKRHSPHVVQYIRCNIAAVSSSMREKTHLIHPSP